MNRAWLATSLALAALAACAEDDLRKATTIPAPGDAGVPGNDASAMDAGTDESAFDDLALEEGELLPGGATTTTNTGIGAFALPVANLPLARRNAFEAGLQFFQLPWEVAPGRREADGLGPLFNSDTCLGCHVRNGRGTAQTVLLRLGLGPDNVPDPVYGSQLQPFGIPGIPGEARPVRQETAVVRGGVELVGVTYTLAGAGYGPFGDDLRISPRIAPTMVGQGLLEAIAERDLVAGEDPDDRDGDGISGRVHWVLDGGVRRMGRFGWKAGQPTVEAQTAAAFSEDLGITTPVFPNDTCSVTQVACRAAPNGGTPELTAERLHVTAAHVRLLSVPVRRNGEAVLAGKRLFHQTGCAACHKPSFRTDATAIEPELADQLVWPYTDLLLHDLGEELSDHRREGDAGEREWRTPPLWSLGLVLVVNGELHLLHDGRARTVEEAVLWHGGEAERARRAFEALSPAERSMLVGFVESL